LILVITRT